MTQQFCYFMFSRSKTQTLSHLILCIPTLMIFSFNSIPRASGKQLLPVQVFRFVISAANRGRYLRGCFRLTESLVFTSENRCICQLSCLLLWLTWNIISVLKFFSWYETQVDQNTVMWKSVSIFNFSRFDLTFNVTFLWEVKFNQS